MNVNEYSKIVCLKWAELVDFKIGWDIFDKVEIQARFNRENEIVDIYYNDIRWASVLPGEESQYTFEIYTINLLNLEDLATDRNNLANLIIVLAALIEASNINDIETRAYIEFRDELDRKVR